MISDRLKAMIRELNPQWEGKEIAVPPYKRTLYASLLPYTKTRQILAIVGLRRVGKTVLLRQLMHQLGKEAQKENVLYFLFDDLLAQQPEMLDELLDYYVKTVAGQGKKYVFLDEIQKVPYWQDILKRWYDTREDIKFVVSGSASLRIKKSKESLAGRIFDFYLPVLSFREFLNLSGVPMEKVTFRNLKKHYEENLHKKALLEKQLEEYVWKGAFPELVNEKDDVITANYIRNSVVEKMVMEDIPLVFGVKKKDVLFALLEYCCRETATLFDVSSAAKTLNANYQTVRSDLFYLQHSFAVDVVYNFSGGAAAQLRKNKKIHVAHPALSIALERYPRPVALAGDVMGRYMESIVFQHAKLLSNRVAFWRTPQKEEVDIIIGGSLPVEVKYKNSIDGSDMKPLLKWMNTYRARKGVVVTKDIYAAKTIKGKTVMFVPVWLFLLMV